MRPVSLDNENTYAGVNSPWRERYITVSSKNTVDDELFVEDALIWCMSYSSFATRRSVSRGDRIIEA